MVGITNTTAVSLDNLTSMANNLTGYADFAIRANNDIYGGWLYFIILIVLGVITYMVLQERDDQPLNNIMYSSAFITLGSLFLRAVEMAQNGIVRGLITDKQMWIFPLIAMITAAIIWANKDR